MSSTHRKKKRREMIIRGWLAVILLVCTLGLFIYAIWDGTQYGFTSNTVKYGMVIIGLLFVTGVVGGPTLRSWEAKRKGEDNGGTRVSQKFKHNTS